MESKIRQMNIVTYFGRKYIVDYEDGTTIKEFKQAVKTAVEKDYPEDLPDFNLIYGGKKLVKESDTLSEYLKEGNNTFYTMASEVHGGCTPKCKITED